MRPVTFVMTLLCVLSVFGKHGLAQPMSPEYRVFEDPRSSTSQAGAQNVCRGQGGFLASVTGDALRLALAGSLRGPGPVYIGQWNGDGFGNQCLALYPDGAITGT
jgi:hypothetical protein